MYKLEKNNNTHMKIIILIGVKGQFVNTGTGYKLWFGLFAVQNNI